MQEDHLGQVVSHGSCGVAGSHQSQQNVQIVTDCALLCMSYKRSLSQCTHCFSQIHSDTLTPSHFTHAPSTHPLFTHPPLHSPTLHTCTPPLTHSSHTCTPPLTLSSHTSHTSHRLTYPITLHTRHSCTPPTHPPSHPPSLPPTLHSYVLPHTHPKVSPEHSHELSHHFHYLIVRVGVVGEPRGLTDCDDGDIHPPAANTHQQHVKHVACCRGSLIPRLPRSGV